MPLRWGTPEEFERLTGSRGSMYIGPAPVSALRDRKYFCVRTAARCAQVHAPEFSGVSHAARSGAANIAS